MKPDYILSLLEVLKYLIPALVVFLVVQYMLKNFFDNESRKRNIELKLETNKLITPLKLQSYERMVILMERMSPNNLIFRVSQPGISATQLKIALIQDINNEFNHNVSQQIYISPQAWQMIRIAKEEMINIINTAYSSLGPNSVGIDLSKAIFEHMMQKENIPTDNALTFLRKEFHLLFD
ncbi:MAG: hypothetical protein MUC81_06200 [Bacteroidia bacterium]|jgi:hypothetical protein|nr:hypothetical protein [Bacteroidia bacterium]